MIRELLEDGTIQITSLLGGVEVHSPDGVILSHRPATAAERAALPEDVTTLPSLTQPEPTESQETS